MEVSSTYAGMEETRIHQFKFPPPPSSYTFAHMSGTGPAFYSSLECSSQAASTFTVAPGIYHYPLLLPGVLPNAPLPEAPPLPSIVPVPSVLSPPPRFCGSRRHNRPRAEIKCQERKGLGDSKKAFSRHTILCKHFSAAGECPMGDFCDFIHDDNITVHQAHCWAFVQGRCRSEANCKYYHPEDIEAYKKYTPCIAWERCKERPTCAFKHKAERKSSTVIGAKQATSRRASLDLDELAERTARRRRCIWQATKNMCHYSSPGLKPPSTLFPMDRTTVLDDGSQLEGTTYYPTDKGAQISQAVPFEYKGTTFYWQETMCSRP